MNVVKKLSSKVILGGRPDIPPKDHKGPKWVYEIVGIVNRTKEGSSDFGPYLALHGTFQATNLETGEISRASKCYLPDLVTDMIAGQMVGEVNEVQFGFRVGVIRDDTAATGYVYAAEPLVELQQNDPLAGLLQLTGPVKGKAKAA